MMTFGVKGLLKGTNEVDAETVTYTRPELGGWTDTHVREVPLSTLRIFDRVNSGDGIGVAARPELARARRGPGCRER